MARFKKKKYQQSFENTERYLEGFADDQKVIGDAPDIVRMMPKCSYHSCWATPESFYKYIETTDSSKSWDGGDTWTSSNESFTGTKSWADAMKLAKEGWKEGADQIENVRNYIRALNPIGPKIAKFAMAGAVPDVPRAVSGNILNMKVPENRNSKKKPVITLISNCCVNGGTDPQRITNRAAVVAALIDEIESRGFSCEVISTALTAPGKFSAATSVVAKTCNQPVDILRMAFSLGHASMFRRFMFADWQTEHSCKEGLGWGLGRAMDFKPSPELAEKAIYVIPSGGMSSKMFKTPEASATAGLNYIVDALRSQGCPAFPAIKSEKEELAILERMKKNDYDYDNYDPSDDDDDE